MRLAMVTTNTTVSGRMRLAMVTTKPARRLVTAAAWCKQGSWPIINRPQLTKLPHKPASTHFHVAHPSGFRQSIVKGINGTVILPDGG